ncbi:hypothetical protein ACRZ29_000241 [Edwardsiella piscicida]
MPASGDGVYSYPGVTIKIRTLPSIIVTPSSLNLGKGSVESKLKGEFTLKLEKPSPGHWMVQVNSETPQLGKLTVLSNGVPVLPTDSLTWDGSPKKFAVIASSITPGNVTGYINVMISAL